MIGNDDGAIFTRKNEVSVERSERVPPRLV